MYPHPSKVQWSGDGMKVRRSSQATSNVWFGHRIGILSRNAEETSPIQRIYRAASAILALVQNRMIDDEDSVQLSKYCFNMCQTLKTAIQGVNADDPNNNPVRVALKEVEWHICEVELILRRGADAPDTKYDKKKVESHRLSIQQLLVFLLTPTSPLNEGPSTAGQVPLLAPIDPHNTVITSAFESETAFKHLMGRAFYPHQLPSLIQTIFSSQSEGDIIRCLHEDNAQTFVDVIDQSLDRADLSPQVRKKCLKSLYKVCGLYALVPTAMRITVWYDRVGSVALYRGGFADVWKGEYCGREVAVKVIRTYTGSDLQKIIGRFCKEVVTWRTLRHPNVLPLVGVMMSEAQFAMISDWMGNGNINDFVKAHPDANRLELLTDVARGLIYIHSREMTHGDLKGANILIDQTCHARLADFGLLTIMSDPTNLMQSSSYAQGGTARWMSPELIDPQRFGLESSRPTKSSDCYALGMVIYETISGHLPFHKHTDLTVFVKVLEGKRPPRAVGFTDSLWEMLKLCWMPQSNARPNIEDILQYLERSSQPPGSQPPGISEGDQGTNSSSGPPSVRSEFPHVPGRLGFSDSWLPEPPSSNGPFSPDQPPPVNASALDPISLELETAASVVKSIGLTFHKPPHTSHNPHPLAPNPQGGFPEAWEKHSRTLIPRSQRAPSIPPPTSLPVYDFSGTSHDHGGVDYYNHYVSNHPPYRGSEPLKQPGSSRSQNSTKTYSSPPPAYGPRPPIPDDAPPPLFDPIQGQRPNPVLMNSFVDAFFRTGGGQFGFLEYDELTQRICAGDLNYPLANSIAAWATRHEKIPKLGNLDKMYVSGQYVARAKLLLASPLPEHNLSILHSIIVLAWLRSSYLDEFHTFAQSAKRVSSDMNITAAIEMSSGDPSHRKVLQQTWSSVNRLVNVSEAQSNLGKRAAATNP